MADADITIKDAAGVDRKVDTRTVGASTDEHREVVVIGDATTAANVAAVDSSGRVWGRSQAGQPIANSVSLTGPSNGVWGTDIDCRGYSWLLLRLHSVSGSPYMLAYGAADSGGTYDTSLPWLSIDATNGSTAARYWPPGSAQRFTYILTPPPFLKIEAAFGGNATAVSATLEMYSSPTPFALSAAADPRIWALSSVSGSPETLRSTQSAPSTGGRLFTAPSTKATALLSAVTATGAGAAANFDVGYAAHGVQVTHTGSPSAVIVTLQGTIDGTNWFTLATWTSASQASGDIVFTADKPVTQVRANLTTLTDGTAPTVTATYCGVA